MSSPIDHDSWDEFLAEPDGQQGLAEHNLASLAQLFEMLTKARELAGLNYQQVADSIGATPEVVRSIEAGRLDVTLTELMQYAFAIEAALSYKVTPRHNPRHHMREKAARSVGKSSWIDFGHNSVAVRVSGGKWTEQSTYGR